MLARDSVFTLVRRGLTAQQTGEALHADLVLAGAISALPMHFRLRIEMIRVSDGTQIWVEDVLVRRDLVAGVESELVELPRIPSWIGRRSLAACMANWEPCSRSIRSNRMRRANDEERK